MKRFTLIFSLVFLFLVSFSYSEKVFSQEEIVLKIIQGSNGNTVLKVFTPSSMVNIYMEIYDENEEILAGIYEDVYSIEVLDKTRKNTFMVNIYRLIEDRQDVIIRLFPNTQREESYYLGEIEKIEEEHQQQKKNDEKKELRVMSFNIHHGKNIFGFYTLDKVSEVIKENDVDLVGLQEVDKYVARSKFEDQVKKLAIETSMYYAFAPNVKIMGAEYGNAILSKYPIESYSNVKLPSSREKRGLLMGKVKIGDHHINFLVTHLGLSKDEKEIQFEVLRKYVEFLGEKTILVGDLNSRENHDGIQGLKKSLLDTATINENIYKHTFDGLVVKSRIDYIFASPDFVVSDYHVINTDISDHLPIVACLTLR